MRAVARLAALVPVFVFAICGWAQQAIPAVSRNTPMVPPRVADAERFLANRGVGSGKKALPRTASAALTAAAPAQSSTGTWQPLGPAGVLSGSFGLVTGRVSSLALDPADPEGNRLYVGTTGGGVWLSQNAAAPDPSSITFTPLTDNLSAMSAAVDASISIGAISVQPNGTGVVLVGTGDPNDSLDSYYGAGILRSADGGNTWTLIQTTADMNYEFVGEGFAGFAWSTTNPQLVVAAVSQAFEGILVDAGWSHRSYAGLYYSSDGGATWSLAQITDPGGQDVQGPLDLFASPDGNAATSVVWNPVRGIFIAAVRLHGYYQSTDGAHWTRLAAQPGAGLTSTSLCPTQPGTTGSPACPIYRGALAVNPSTGDTFAWTVDINDQDQGLFQDLCAASGGACTNQAIAWGKQWPTTGLESNTWLGGATIQDGNYNLALAAVPANQDTMLLAGANDLWKCNLAVGCLWRNTTNATSCESAKVAPYQHALEWSLLNPQEVFVGNDSGLWRSVDAIAQSDPVCSPSDADHFQNLNGGLGSLAEVESMSEVGASPYTMMLGLGANGTAGVKSTSGPTADWQQILTGEGGPVAIDPKNPSNWYVNNGAGVSIHVCSKAGACTPADFGSAPAVSNADVNNDGLTMTSPAPFLVDPVDPAQLLIGTCRLWRGPANGAGWTAANAVGAMFGGNRTNSYCSGNPLVRSMAAMALAGGGEVVYVGMYGSQDGGATLAGHVLAASMNASGTWSGWRDLTLNPVINDSYGLNAYGLDISSLFIDPHDTTGNTIYVTVAGVPSPQQVVRVVYGSTDGGAHWSYLQSNLPNFAANSLVIDPQNANTAYLATDGGVYITSNVGSCASAGPCWSAYGAGLPGAPVTTLSAAPPSTSPNVLVAGTYGRGVWQIPLATAGTQMTTATVSPTSVDFGVQSEGSASPLQTVTLTNTSPIALAPTLVSLSGPNSADFILAGDHCTGAQVSVGATCTIQLAFSPSSQGGRTATLTISANVQGGQFSVALAGNGVPCTMCLMPASGNFDQVQSGPTPIRTTSKAITFSLNNSSANAAAISNISTDGPFAQTNLCGSTIQGGGSCQITVTFTPVQRGQVSGTLKIVDDAGTQTAYLVGTGAAPPTDTMSPMSVGFPDTVIGQSSPPQYLSLTNSGDLPLTSISASIASQATSPFHITSNNCTGTLAANSTPCSIAVIFTPTQAGAQSGSLIEKDSVNPGQTISLSGTGQLPAASDVVQIVPAYVDFPPTGVGTPSSPVTLAVMNAAAGPVLTDLSLKASSGFTLANSTCGTSLATAGTCTVSLTFAPSAVGAQTGTFSVSSSALFSSKTISLSGTGFDFQVAVSGAASQTVSSGQTANYSLTLTPAAGLAGTFTFQCGTLPSYAACVFNPTSANAPAAGTGSVTVQVTTSQGSSASLVRPRTSGWPMLPAVLALMAFPWLRRRKAGVFWAGVLLAGMAFGFSACSSSGGGTGGTSPPPPQNHSTPAGTYSIPVTVTSAGVQHAVTLTLVVD